jgi:hypothetical protein
MKYVFKNISAFSWRDKRHKVLCLYRYKCKYYFKLSVIIENKIIKKGIIANLPCYQITY